MTQRLERSRSTVHVAVAAGLQSAWRCCRCAFAASIQAVVAFAKCRRGGAMLLAGFIGMTLLTSVGAMMSNYAWREAQSEELQAALRAAVSTAGPLFPGAADPTVQENIKTRVANVLGGLVPGLKISADDVTVDHDTSTDTTRVSIGGNAEYKYTSLWGDEDNDSDVQLPRHTVAVALDITRYEMVIAVDITSSMQGTRLSNLKNAVGVALDITENVSAQDPGTLLVGMVPFSHAVNVADTSGSGETNEKKRYAHMLGGAPRGDADAAKSAHWVDMYHHYGSSGGTWGNDLQTRTLPIFASTTSWNLRGAVDIDLSDEAPSVGTWSVQREDFWNGCVMARWGAYWDEDARPAACVAGCQRQCAVGDSTCTQCATGCWHADMSQNASLWPARKNVDAWTPLSNALTAEPLHLSDAPPDGKDPNARFTAYSWPDGRVSATSDARLLGVLLETLEPGRLDNMDRVKYVQSDNHWSYPSTYATVEPGAGDWYCPANAIMPLSEDIDALRAATNGLTTIPDARRGGTYLHLGVVWGLRVLSPLWKNVWATTDDAGVSRPLTPCAPGETGTHCRSFVQKTLLLISDGFNTFSEVNRMDRTRITRGRVTYSTQHELFGSAVPWARRTHIEAPSKNKVCEYLRSRSQGRFRNAIDDTSSSSFDARFANLNAAGQFAGASHDRLVAAFEKVMETTLPSAGKDELANKTPWELFRNRGFLSNSTSTNFIDTLMTTSNGFNFDGRPVFDDMACGITSNFGAYGRIYDVMQVGDEPVAGVAPFAGIASATSANALTDNGTALLDDWLLDACRIVKARGVHMKIIFLGARSDTAKLETMRQCIDAAGGNRNTDLLFAPTRSTQESTFRRIFTIRRNLRFLN